MREAIKDVIHMMREAIKDVIHMMREAIKDVIHMMREAIKDVVHLMREAIKDVVHLMRKAIREHQAHTSGPYEGVHSIGALSLRSAKFFSCPGSHSWPPKPIV